jgi:hypothetical protein
MSSASFSRCVAVFHTGMAIDIMTVMMLMATSSATIA